MSAKSEELEQADEVCASCGVAGVDAIKLKDCDECQENHREQHEEECMIRKAELHDKKLFTKPDISHLGECPICFLPLSIDLKKSIMMSCCSKTICKGCYHANKKRENEQGLQQRCAFCRNPMPKSKEEVDKRVMKRINKHNDPAAMTQMGNRHAKEGDYGKSFEYFTKSAELGDVTAHSCLGRLYFKGEGVERDMAEAIHHWEQAALGGHPDARILLANYEMDNDRYERAAKHLIINANLGHDKSLQQVKELFVQGVVSKEEYAAALRAHQAAVDATKSAEREKAEAFHEFKKHLDGAK